MDNNSVINPCSASVHLISYGAVIYVLINLYYTFNCITSSLYISWPMAYSRYRTKIITSAMWVDPIGFVILHFIHILKVVCCTYSRPR